MVICTIQLLMFQSKCKWQHRCAQTHTHARTHCHKARENDRNDLTKLLQQSGHLLLETTIQTNLFLAFHIFFFNFHLIIAIIFTSHHNRKMIIKRKEKGLTMQCIRKRWEAQSMLQRLSSAWHSDILWNWRKLSNPFFLTKRTSFL